MLHDLLLRIGPRKHHAAIDLRALAFLNRFVEGCAAEHPQAGVYVGFEVREVVTGSGSVHASELDEDMGVDAYGRTLIRSSNFPALSGRITIHSWVDMVRVVVR